MRTRALAVAAVLVVSGCSGHSATKTLTVLAASSLTDAFQQLGKDFETAHPGTKVRFSFGASSTLAAQVEAGAPADVLASASTKNMNTLVAAREAVNPVTFARNSAEIAVTPGSVTRVRALTDLATAKVALCRPEVPCGALATRVLEAAHVHVTPVTYGADVKAVLATVKTGEVDAGLVYVTDVKAAGSSVVGVAVPTAVNASTAYPIAVLTSSKEHDLASQFTAFVLSPAGQNALQLAGFQGP
jgi:molybdate transport system substrate-binding protein